MVVPSQSFSSDSLSGRFVCVAATAGKPLVLLIFTEASSSRGLKMGGGRLTVASNRFMLLGLAYSIIISYYGRAV